MHVTGRGEYFSAPDPNATTLGGPLDTAKFNAAVTRLLDLRLLESRVAPDRGLYAYHWTYLGKQVLLRLTFRSAGTT